MLLKLSRRWRHAGRWIEKDAQITVSESLGAWMIKQGFGEQWSVEPAAERAVPVAALERPAPEKSQPKVRPRRSCCGWR